MENNDAERESRGQAVRLEWGALGATQMMPADEVFIQDLGDRIFLTFGQIQLPLNLGAVPDSIQVLPVARLVMTRASMQKLQVLLANRSTDQSEKSTP